MPVLGSFRAPFGIGAAGGVLDTIAAEKDAKKIAADAALATPVNTSLLKQYGTYVNYVIPAAEVLLAGFGVVKPDLGIALMTSAGSLAAAKLTRSATMAPFGKKKQYSLTYSKTPSAWTRDMPYPARQDRYINYGTIPNHPAQVVPIVQPQETLGNRGDL